MADGSQTAGVDRGVARKAQAFGLLERLCQQLELTDTQYERAKGHYQAVGAWLSEAEDDVLTYAEIYPQGSVSHGTTVRPLGRKEHDVDLIAFLTGAGPATPPGEVKQAVGDRLRSNGRYRDILEEMPRCWRLNYAGDFHLDITPAIRNPQCDQGGELVPDKKLRRWKSSNPKGFRSLFAKRAALRPATLLEKSHRATARADVVPFPVQSATKGVLRRTVQLLKRHRDVAFTKRDTALAPLSIIITQLAARSYEYCVQHYAYENEFDLLLDTIRMMPVFVERHSVGGQPHSAVWNETTQGENFAEKWNAHPERADAFIGWHRAALADFERVQEMEGLDEVGVDLGDFLGRDMVEKAIKSITDDFSAARGTTRLGVVAGLGLTTSVTAPAIARTSVPANTFFGRRP